MKEILIYHHSHLDVGYTHAQPVLWELQRAYIDQALDLCEQSEGDKPDERFRWTCEATAPVVKWLEAASERDIERFAHYVRNGQICLTAVGMHTAPLSGAEQLARMLYPAKMLRERFGVPIRTAINHDVNGQPWTFAQLLLDAGVELYTTGVNIHFGGIPLPRPLVFRWQAPDGRELLTFNGEHYSLFTQFCELWEKDLARMKEGMERYLMRLESENYPYDFVYLSATNSPMFDNTPPDWELSEMIKRWNNAGYEPRMRLATPEALLDKIRSSCRYEEIPVFAGDWTDYWNFGAASSAAETKLSRRAKTSLGAAEWLAAFQGTADERERTLYREAWEQLDLFDEHTWGANVSVTEPDSMFTRTLWMHKAHTAYQANSVSGYLLAAQLDRLAGNPPQSVQPEGLLLVNPAHVPQKVDIRIPEDYRYAGRHTSAHFYKFLHYHMDADWTAPSSGTVELPPFSWKKIPLAELAPAEKPEVAVTGHSIETPFYALSFDPATGRIEQLHDKRLNWPMLDPAGEWTLFQFVQERIDGGKQPDHRTSLFPRELDKCNNSISCWNREWPAIRKGAERLLECRVERHDSGATLVLRWEAPGVRNLEQRITFFADHPRIELAAAFHKEDIREPEAIYFAFPLRLNAGWKAVFDSAGAFVELDREQLPTASKDWVTVEHAVSVCDGEKGVTLACPDAPLVQIGDFNFGREHAAIARSENPLLLAWPVNNYWDTNFKASQPGRLTLKYELLPFAEFRPEDALSAGVAARQPVQAFPAVVCGSAEEGTLLAVDNPRVAVLYVKPASDGEGVILRLQNLSGTAEETAKLDFPGRRIRAAYATDMLESMHSALPFTGTSVRATLSARRLGTVRIVFEA